MRRAVPWTVAREDNPPIGSISGHDVVIVCRLIWNFDDDRRSSRIEEIADLVQLPKELRG